MAGMRRHPLLYEINARLFIRRVSEKYHRALTLATIPDEECQSLVQRGFDLVWLMGVWQRSPDARQQALANPVLRQQYDRALPGWTEADIAGSPYAILNYRLDPALGKPGELAQLRSRLNHLGLGLVLDFVPNHLARDHPWTISHPNWFVPGNKADVLAHPDWFFTPDGSTYLAHGRDPNFPPWTDTAQLNLYSPELRQALITELGKIAEVADGVRCDMAMLALNDVFQGVWGAMVKDYPRPQTEFWAEAIGQVKQHHPDFLFLAEAYWGLELGLQQMGFDFTYDKPFYDRLLSATASDIRSYLMSTIPYQERLARFIENHDESRAVSAFGHERSLAAAVILATVPGLRLFHDGQLAGKRIHLPVQLIREPSDIADDEVIRFYDRLLRVVSQPAFHNGEWGLVEVDQNSLLAWSWRYGKQMKVAVVNYSPSPGEGFIKLLLPQEAKRELIVSDELAGVTHRQNVEELSRWGLYVNLASYHTQILAVDWQD